MNAVLSLIKLRYLAKVGLIVDQSYELLRSAVQRSWHEPPARHSCTHGTRTKVYVAYGNGCR